MKYWYFLELFAKNHSCHVKYLEIDCLTAVIDSGTPFTIELIWQISFDKW